VGSTANWGRRLQCHKSSCHNENGPRYNYKLYQTIRANGGWCEFKMIEIGKAEQLTHRQADEIEETYRIDLKADMNGKRCFVAGTKKEYDKQYYIDNAEQKKEYRIDNAERRNEKQKQYYNNNKSKINTCSNEKHNCACGGRYTTGNLSQHNKTQQHQTYIKNNPIKIDTCIECEN
tara:strand:- start:27 stop:554 length:528 start_codon:yes stop_codon:yes gene_type:complete